MPGIQEQILKLPLFHIDTSSPFLLCKPPPILDLKLDFGTQNDFNPFLGQSVND